MPRPNTFKERKRRRTAAGGRPGGGARIDYIDETGSDVELGGGGADLASGDWGDMEWSQDEDEDEEDLWRKGLVSFGGGGGGARTITRSTNRQSQQQRRGNKRDRHRHHTQQHPSAPSTNEEEEAEALRARRRSALVQRAYEARVVRDDKLADEVMLPMPSYAADPQQGRERDRDGDEWREGLEHVAGDGRAAMGLGMHGLIKWTGEVEGKRGETVELWVDRFDALLLLPTVPAPPPASGTKGEALPTETQAQALPPDPSSERGWSDLDSDAEDLFFMEDDEAEEYLRDRKRRRLLDLRQRRVEALGAERGDEDGMWGGKEDEKKDEEEEDPNVPSEDQLTLMRATARSILSAPNTSVAEMRVLVNHGSDPRYAFLRRGAQQKWKEVWERLRKGEAVVLRKKKGKEEGMEVVGEQEVEEEEDDKGKGKSKALLVDYGSDSDSDSGGQGETDVVTHGPTASAPAASTSAPAAPSTTTLTPTAASPRAPPPVDDAEKAKRLARAKEWARKRKEAKASL